MGVRLVRYNRPINGNGDSNTSQNFDHDELINRDLLNQHPIYAITGLQEILNILEDSIHDLSETLIKDSVDTDREINQIMADLQALDKRITDTENTIKKLQSMKYIDSNSIVFDYKSGTPSLSADVRIWKPRDDTKENTNILKCLGDGLYVPAVSYKDSVTIEWKSQVLGETLREIFDDGIVFSHTPGSWDNVYSASEANAWYWDDSLQSIVQPRNTGTYTGFVTKGVFDYYEHQVQIRSTNSDNDLNGLVIGYVVGEDGLPHNLSVVVDRGGYGGNLLAVWYDMHLPDQQRIAYKTIGGNGGWSSVGNGITIRVEKHKNLVSVVCSRWNSLDLDEAMRIDIDLDNYAWGQLFSGEVHYGYSNRSQPYSFFQNIQFMSSNSASSTEVVGSVNLSDDPTNGLSVKQDGLYSEKFRISAKANNGLTKENDGYWAEKLIISPDQYNALQKKSNGYWVEQIRVSSQAGNALQKLSDGTFYVRDYRNIRTATQANHGFVVGDFIYYHPVNFYQKAKALDDYDANIVGMVTKVINANQFEYQWAGFFATDMFSTSSGYIQGMPVYISDVDAGKVVQEQPDISKTVGYPVENAGIIIAIERGIQYNQEASIGDFKKSANTFNVRSDGFILITENVEYKQSLITRLINTSSESFKSQYMTFDNVAGTMKFKNVKQLYDNNSVPSGMNLFIKAF